MRQDEFNEVDFKPDDFEFLQLDEQIFDSKFETKPIGYLGDAWLRFKKNRASVIAFIILSLIILLAIFGPYMNRYSIESVEANIGELPPRIPLLEKIGIADGHKNFYDVPLNSDEIPILEMDDDGSNIVLYPEGSYKLIGDIKPGKAKDGSDILLVNLDVNLYKIAFGEIKYKTITEQQYTIYKDRGGIIEEEAIYQCETVLGKERCHTYYNITVDYLKANNYSKIPYLLFGTDAIGRDMWTMLWMGTRVSLLVGLVVAIINISIGIIYGSISGYYGGAIDLFMQRFIEILTGIPWIVIMTLVILYLGNNLVSITIALVLVGWTGTSMMVRSQFYRYKGREYVLASRTLGAKDARLIFKHILPNGIGPIVTSSVLVIPSAIFTEAVISYLGLGLGSGVSIGVLLNSGQQVLLSQPHLTIFPAIIISLLMITFNMFGNGLRDALNPSLRGAE